jgi:3-oxoacyl-[acyl-carrier protein] reductase
MTAPLEGRVSLVTGASRGIGRAVADALARDGATVILGARDTGRLSEAVRSITSSGGRAEAVSLDVAERASVEAAFDGILQAHGRLDHLVNNAGITRDNLLLRMKQADWDEVLKTNLTGVFHCTQCALRPMLKQRSGRIVNVSSIVALAGNPGQANYVSSKAGLIGFTKAIAREVASRNITVNAVAPGFIETEMTAAINEKARGRLLESIPLGRIGRPEDVAGVVCFLVSEAAAYMTGQVVTVDGGFHM